jgi:RNA polymerase sigma-70 factor (ECF subfamily)
MFTIARNVQMDNVKRWDRALPLVTDGDARDEDGAAVNEPASDDTADRRYDTELVREALGRLSPEKREALILSRYEGMKYAEIAAGRTAAAAEAEAAKAAARDDVVGSAAQLSALATERVLGRPVDASAARAAVEATLSAGVR